MRNSRKTKVTTSTRKIAVKKTAEPEANVRNTAKVTVKKAVAGTVSRKSNGNARRVAQRVDPVTVSQFPPTLQAEAKTKLRENERLVILSDSEAKTVYI